MAMVVGFSPRSLSASSQTGSHFDVELGGKAGEVGDSITSQPEIGTVYRKTKNGWEDSSIWKFEVNAAASSEPANFQKIHPVVWGLAVLIAVLMTLIIGQDEDEIEALFKELDQYLSQL